MFNRFSTYGSPVNIRFPQGFKLPPQDFILGILCRRVLFHNTFSYGTNVLQQLPVAYNIRNLQIESDAALLRTSRSPGPRNFKSASAISKPSLVRTMISNRFRVSSVNL